MIKVLFLEDEEELGENLKLLLESEEWDGGFQVDWFVNGDEAVQAGVGDDYNLMILDIILKGKQGRYSNGLSVAEAITKKRSIPYLFLSSKSESMDKVAGLKLGAEDYVTKPYDFDELLERIKKIIRRSKASADDSKTLQYKDLLVETVTRKVKVNGNRVEVTPIAYDILVYLMKRKGELVFYEDLIREVWGYEKMSETDHNNLMVAMGRLRKEIGSDYISTQRKAGYIFGD